MRKCGTHWLAWILLIIGGINWGLIGLGYFFNANWNIVRILLGNWPLAEALVYILVGIAALVSLFEGNCRSCRMKNTTPAM